MVDDSLAIDRRYANMIKTAVIAFNPKHSNSVPQNNPDKGYPSLPSRAQDAVTKRRRANIFPPASKTVQKTTNKLNQKNRITATSLDWTRTSKCSTDTWKLTHSLPPVPPSSMSYCPSISPSSLPEIPPHPLQQEHVIPHCSAPDENYH
jgi:hypothetical protein